MESEIVRELGRKAFHLVTLVYLAAYLWLERPVLWLGAWFALVAAVELSRLALPAFNRLLSAPFAGFMREEETRRLSGIFHTALGSLLTVWLFGDQPRVVKGALLCLAFADAAAALAGKRWGRHAWSLAGKRKSLEGGLACFLAALACLGAVGLPWAPALAAAAVCAAVEAAPLPVNDNSILPVATGAALSLTLKML